MDRSRVSRCALAGALLVALAGTALAQGPSRVDCAKAATPIERAICAKPELAAADRKMAAAYAALAGKLTGAAKDHLLADQIRWLANRAAACVVDPAEMEECLESRDRDRTAQLEWLGEGAYPFISEQAIVKTGKVRGIPYIIDASYPQFDAGTADFSGVNRQLASAASEAGDRAVPGPDADNDGGNYNGPAWRYEQAYTLHKPGPNAVSVKIAYGAYEGGAHGIVGVTGMLVDLRTGKAVGPEGVFLPTSNWLRELTRIVSADINTPNLADILKQPQRYVFLEDRLELSFNQYEGGPYTVEIPYDRLAAVAARRWTCAAMRAIAGRSQRAVRQPAIRLCASGRRADAVRPCRARVGSGRLGCRPEDRRTGRYRPSAREEPRQPRGGAGLGRRNARSGRRARLYIKQSHMGEGRAISAALRAKFGDNPPCSTWIGVTGLADEQFLIEVEPSVVFLD